MNTFDNSTFKSSKKLKADARASLLGHLTTPVIAVLIYLLTTSLLTEMIANFASGSVLLSLLLSVVVFLVVNTVANMLRIGLASIFLRLQLSQNVRIGDLFCAFRGNSDTAVKFSGFLAFTQLLFMLPAIIAMSVFSAQARATYSVLIILLLLAGLLGTVLIRIRYALCPYLFLDFPELPVQVLLRGGVKMIDGHKGRLFMLYLSFLPLHFLSFLSLGIAGLLVSSYSYAAEAAFYRDLTLHLSGRQ